MKSSKTTLLLAFMISASTLLPITGHSAETLRFCHAAFKGLNEAADQNFSSLTSEQKLALRRRQAFSPDKDQKRIERRPKFLTSGEPSQTLGYQDASEIKIDTADPSIVLPIKYPDGVIKYRINFSGLRYIEADSPAELYKGGIRTVKRSRGFYADGTEMIGSYHNASWPWDVVIYTNDQGEQIAFGGVMKQPGKGQLPNVADHNYTRSRWWGKVVHIPVKGKPGQYEERIIWQEPLHDFNRPADNGWENHGYGGTLYTRFNPKKGLHEPVKLPSGNYLLVYEKVVTFNDAGPTATELFVREIDPTLKNMVGKEYSATNLRTANGEYFDIMKRGAPFFGVLAEGGNLFHHIKTNFILQVWSGNDYVRKYGIVLDYRKPGASPKSQGTVVTDKTGQAVDFASKLGLRELLHGTWLGRPQLEYAPDGQIWMKFHEVRIEEIPPGAPIEGWPSYQEFLSYGRVSLQVPVKIVYKNAVPSIELDIDEKFADLWRP